MNTDNCQLAGKTNITPSKPPLDQAILRLESEIGGLSNGLSELYSRLSPVLGVSKAAPTNTPNPQPIGSSAAVEMLQQLSVRVEMMHDELAFVHSRLEV